MKSTISLVTAPGTQRIPWQIGDRVLVTLFNGEVTRPQSHRVIYVDPQRISLERLA